jgi:hypothetical protein
MNSVVHFELPADDVERAQAFYREVFDWSMNSMPGMGYTMVSTSPTDESGRPSEPGTINGGMLARQAPVTAPTVTIGVDDIDATLNTIEKLGGRTALGKQPVGDMGFSAYFVDTEGNVIGLWQNA